MEKVKIGVDQQVISECENALSGYLEHWKAIKLEYDLQELRPLTTKDLQRVFSGEEFLKKIALEDAGEAKIGKVKISESKLLALIDLKHSSRNFIEAINKFTEFKNRVRTLPILITDFCVVDDRICFPKAEAVLESRCSIYIDDPQRIELFNFLTQVCAAANKCTLCTPGQFILRPDRNIILLSPEGKYEINPMVLRRS